MNDQSIWIQQKTFTAWINEQLRSSGHSVKNLQTDLSNGIKLIALVECLQKRQLNKTKLSLINNNKILNQHHQSIENVQIALNAIASDHIRLINISSADIVSGNLKLILGLLWQLITRYQLGKATTPPKKLMLSWLESALPELKITNFTRDWNNGIALAALLDFCRPGVFSDWPKLSPKNCLENCHRALTIAQNEFNIPMIIMAEDLCNPNLDEKSALTYLSYFMKENGPGFNLIMNWTKQMLPDCNITNLTTDWNSGILFCRLLHKLGANIPNVHSLKSDKKYWENNWSLAFDGGRKLGIEPPNQLKAKHFSDPNIEYISLMAYLTKLYHLSSKHDVLRIIGVNLNNVFVQKEALFKIEILENDIELESVRSEVHSPSNKLVTSEITVNKFGGQGKFTPLEPGLHELKIFYRENLATKPLMIKVHPDLTNVIFSGIEPCSVGSLVEVVINSNGAGSSDVKVIAVSSTHRELNCELIEKDNSIIANFIPDEIGEWRIAITYSGEHINGSPFPCLVYDSNQIKVNYNDIHESLDENIQFSIDTREAGWGKLNIQVVHSSNNQQPVPIEIDERGNGVYNVWFKPTIVGKYLIHITFNQQEIPNSPFEINVRSNTLINDLNDRMNRATIDERAKLLAPNITRKPKSIEIMHQENQEIYGTQLGQIAQLEINNISDVSKLSYFVKDPMQQELSATLKRIKSSESNLNDDYSYKLEFKPLMVGQHQVFIDIDDQPVTDSPFIWNVYDCNQVKVVFPSDQNFLIGHDVHFEIDTNNAGQGNLEITIDNGATLATTKQLTETKYLCLFKPQSAETIIDIRFNGEPVPQSPFHLESITNGVKNGNESDNKSMNRAGTFHIESLENFKVNQTNSFTITVKNMSISVDDLSVSILNMAILTAINYHITEESDNVFRVTFQTSIIGDYEFKIFFKDSIIHTFNAKAYDISKIVISDIPAHIILGQKCSIQVDASNAGEGQLEIAVNDGEVPNHVQVLGNGKCLITFQPELPIQHVVDIKFNNENIIGCPFVCQVDEFPDLKFDLSKIELVQVGHPVCFEIDSSNYRLEKSNFSVIITSATNKIIPVNLTYSPRVICEFIPNEVGPYAINFEYCSKLIYDQPFIIKSFDPTKVIVSAPANGCVGKTIQFIVDAIYAGEGNLEISVVTNEKNVPTQVQPIGGAKFAVCFTPTQANDHVVSITFNNIPVNGNPFMVNVLPSTDKPIVTGSALHYSPVDQIARLTIHNVDSENEIIAKVQDGNNQVVSANIIKDLQNQCIHLEFLPKMPGEYKVQIKYRNEHVQGSPFLTKIYDIKKIKVKDIPEEICLGKMVTFLVEATNAGPGNLEVIVNNGKVPSTPKSLGPSLYAISFVPTDPEIHVIEIKFNGKNVENSPFRCKILDTEKVMFQPLEKVSVNKVAQITIDTNGGLLTENSIIILSPSHRNLKPILLGDHLNGYQIQFIPNEVGDHAVDIKIGGNSIPGCPFLVKVYDAKKVKVTDIKNGFVGKPIYFSINASPAGAGNLEIIVSSNGRNVPNYVQSEGNARFRVNFKPTEATLHTISCKFNGEPVPGSPFNVQVFEANTSLGALFSESSIKNISLHKGVAFRIENPNNEIKQCQVMVTSPTNKNISPLVEKLPKCFSVRFKPTEIGPHQMMISLNGLPIPGSPFTCNVYDVNKIKIEQLQRCQLHKPHTFQVDASQAGEGTLELFISTDNSSVRAEVLMKSRGLYDVTFVPQECVPHYLNMTFNDEDVPGSPFNIEIIEPVAISPVPLAAAAPPSSTVDIDRTQKLTGRINQVNMINLRSKTSSSINNLRANIIGPNKTKISGSLIKMDDQNFKLEYIPKTIGKHRIEILENDRHLWKDPLFIEVVDPNQIQVTIPSDCFLGRQFEFNVDARKAGDGELMVKILSPATKEVPLRMEEIESKLYRVSFIPKTTDVHHIEIYLDNYAVIGSPFSVNVQTPVESIIIYGEGLKTAHCNDRAIFFIESEELSANDFDIIVTEPTRSPLPVKCYQQKNGCLLVEWMPKKIGPHKIDVFHRDKPVIGSPFQCEVFDASNVKIEPIESSRFVINKKITLHLNRKNAGYAELDVTVTSPLGRHLPIEVKGMHNGEGELIEFVPTVPGKYKIAITYGNVEIPDSPITFFAQESILPKVSGNGLRAGQLNEPCHFQIDAKDIYGSPEIKIDGPESETSFLIEKCNDIYKVTYIPLEIGIFDVKVSWNGQEIPESPFHPHIVDIDKVRLIGGWENILDNHNRLNCCIGEEKKLIFDTSAAGIGKLTVKIKHENNFEDVPVEPIGSSHKHRLIFKPKYCGEYEIYVYFESFLLPRTPIHAIVNENSTEGVSVVLRGHGLAGARVGEEAEIIIDGKDAGDGEPDVTLTGVKSDIKVKIVAIGPRLYRALYEPRIPGTYLLNVLWNQKQVKGCPLKVPILPSCDAKRVICSGDGLKGGTIGKEIKAFIDTRRAGPGELSAQCMGPNRAAICELYDQNDGTFTLLIHPHEGGKHTLTIKYGGQHVIGSPFLLRIYAAPDASKVKVVGPGIEHGVLPIYQSHFLCDTKGAGAGQLTVRIRGPKGAFKVEMQRENPKDRIIYCKYDPTEPGDYRIEVKWAGEHVPGSPFFVMIFDTQDELNRFLRNGANNSMISLPPLNAIERMAGPNYSEEWKQISWKGSTADL